MSIFKKYGILGTTAIATGALIAGIVGSNMIRDGFKDPTSPEAPVEQIAPGNPVLEERLISESDLVADYIAKTYPNAAALDILSNPQEGIRYIQSIQDLQDLGIYSAHTDSLLNEHTSLYHIQGNSLIGLDFNYTDNVSEMAESVKYKTYFSIAKTDSLNFE
jgi:hypothetical protein